MLFRIPLHPPAPAPVALPAYKKVAALGLATIYDVDMILLDLRNRSALCSLSMAGSWSLPFPDEGEYCIGLDALGLLHIDRKHHRQTRRIHLFFHRGQDYADLKHGKILIKLKIKYT